MLFSPVFENKESPVFFGSCQTLFCKKKIVEFILRVSTLIPSFQKKKSFFFLTSFSCFLNALERVGLFPTHTPCQKVAGCGEGDRRGFFVLFFVLLG